MRYAAVPGQNAFDITSALFGGNHHACVGVKVTGKAWPRNTIHDAEQCLLGDRPAMLVVLPVLVLCLLKWYIVYGACRDRVNVISAGVSFQQHLVLGEVRSQTYLCLGIVTFQEAPALGGDHEVTDPDRVIPCSKLILEIGIGT